MCSLIRLLPTTCIALFWSTGLAQVDLDKEPSPGRFIIEGIVVTNEGQRQSLGYTPSDLLFLLCNIDEVPGYTVVVREYRPEVDAGTVAWQMPYGHTYVHLNVGGDEEYPGERVSCEIIRTWVPHQRAQAYLKRSIPSYTELTAQDCIRVVIRLSTVSVPAGKSRTHKHLETGWGSFGCPNRLKATLSSIYAGHGNAVLQQKR